MKGLMERMQSANSLLAPFAVPHGKGLGRAIQETEDETRFPFQRDRDRIIHTDAFRRLKGKTQVFVEGQGDHYRTRLTHTMEVAQISRDLARAMGVNEDLAECIALAHDLGHPPFGHAGEEALDLWMQKHGGHFEHNEQSLRIVTAIERHSMRYTGLNLNQEVLEGLQKHSTPFDHPNGHVLPHSPSLEAQITNIADEIAYTGHDTDDGLRAKLFTLQDIRSVELADAAAEQADERGTSPRGALIQMMVLDLLKHSEELIADQTINTLEDVYATQTPLIVFSDSMRIRIDALRSFLWQRMYSHPRVQDRNQEGQEIIQKLCNSYESKPTEKVLEFKRDLQCSLPEAIKDYVAGMTDAYAALQAQKS